jgi:hypothetical protein
MNGKRARVASMLATVTTRSGGMATFLVAAVVAVLVAGPAWAQPAPSRVAVLVGANLPAPGRAPLMFGHDDATKMASVLTTVAGFRQRDVFVLKDPSAADLLKAVRTAAERLADRPESLLYFYYSGHADDQALYPAGQPVKLAELRAVIDQARVSVRIGMVDACQGGAWTRAKGLRPVVPFPVRWPLSLDAEGSVLIASSSGLESAHESDQLRGSFFTHHFATGLRGAADRNSNGEVTITEAFEYAKERTIRDTLKVAREPQHPSFAVNLRGRRDLVLSQIAQARSTLELSQQHGPLELVHIESGVTLLELPAGPRTVKLAVPPGVYLIRKKFPGSIISKEVAVRNGASTSIDEDQLTLVGSMQLVAKSSSLLTAPPLVATTAPPPDTTPDWVKVGAFTGVVVGAAGMGLYFKFALDVRNVNRDLDPYRRYVCADNPVEITCSRDGRRRVPAVTPDEMRYVSELQSEGKRFESYQYASGIVGAIGLAVAVPLIIRWARAGSPPADEPGSKHALQLTPTWTPAGPGLLLNARF